MVFRSKISDGNRIANVRIKIMIAINSLCLLDIHQYLEVRHDTHSSSDSGIHQQYPRIDIERETERQRERQREAQREREKERERERERKRERDRDTHTERETERERHTHRER